MSVTVDGTTGVSTPGLDDSGNASITGNLSVTGAVTQAGAAMPRMVLSTAQASTSGTSIDFTGIPSWVKRITVMFNGVSTNGTAQPTLRLGNGSFVTSGYYSNVMQLPNAGALAGASSGNASAIFLTNTWVAAYDLIGSLTITNITGNTWVVSSLLGSTTTVQAFVATGSLTLSSALDRVRITTSNGTDTFDAGTINIMMEG